MMTDSNYREYSLKNLENWLYDAMSCGEATPQEIYDTIIKVVKDEYYTYKKRASESYELLGLLNGNGQSYEDVLKEKGYYEQSNMTEEELSQYRVSFSCDKDDPSPECKGAWNDFWEDYYYPEESKQYTEEELNAMCDKAASDEEKNKCREYNLREAEYYNKRAELDSKVDQVNRWVLPVEVDGLSGECYVQLPDDLLERAGLKEGDMVHWIDRGDSSFELRKVTKPLGMNEC